MVKNITTVAFNSIEVEKKINLDNYNISSFIINTPPIIVKQNAILKVSNFCHIGTSAGHANNMYLFRIKNVMVNDTKFYTGVGGYPVILTTTLNNNRSLYDENIISLVSQTINSIEIVVDTYTPDASIDKTLYIHNPGTLYLVGQIIRINIASTNYHYRISGVNSNGGITSVTPYDINTNEVIPSATDVFSSAVSVVVGTYINGSGAILTASINAGSITAINITNAGFGYKVGQSLAFSGGGGSGATVTIDSVGPLGQILTFSSISSSSGYSTAPTVSVTATTHTPSAVFALIFGQILKEQIPISLNFSITFIIEQDEF